MSSPTNDRRRDNPIYAPGGKPKKSSKYGRVTVLQRRVLERLMHNQNTLAPIVSSEDVWLWCYRDCPLPPHPDETIRVTVSRLRTKLGTEVIQTVRGLGYILNPHFDCKAFLAELDEIERNGL